MNDRLIAQFDACSVQEVIVQNLAGATRVQLCPADPMRLSLKVHLILTAGPVFLTTNPALCESQVGCGYIHPGFPPVFELDYPIAGPLVCQAWFAVDTTAVGNFYWVQTVRTVGVPCEKMGPSNPYKNGPSQHPLNPPSAVAFPGQLNLNSAIQPGMPNEDQKP